MSELFSSVGRRGFTNVLLLWCSPFLPSGFNNWHHFSLFFLPFPPSFPLTSTLPGGSICGSLTIITISAEES